MIKDGKCEIYEMRKFVPPQNFKFPTLVFFFAESQLEIVLPKSPTQLRKLKAKFLSSA